MRWRPVDESWAVSECGFYVVTKTAPEKRAPYYLAWYRISGVPSSESGVPSIHIGQRCKSAKAAQTLCEEHQSSQLQQQQLAAATT